MTNLARRLSQLEASQAEREAEAVAVQLGCSVQEVLAELAQIRVSRARFCRAHGRDQTRSEMVAELAAEFELPEAELWAELEAIKTPTQS
jgi:hypothetical protein